MGMVSPVDIILGFHETVSRRIEEKVVDDDKMIQMVQCLPDEAEEEGMRNLVSRIVLHQSLVERGGKRSLNHCQESPPDHRRH
jgi:transcriptional regulator